MAGAWKGGLSFANATSIGAATSGTTGGTYLAGSSSTYTKSAWTQLIASTTTDITWVLVSGQCSLVAGVSFALDIGIGASGSEIVIVNNLSLQGVLVALSVGDAFSFFFPLSIPAGTRIAARFSATVGSVSITLSMLGFQDTYQSAGSGSAVDTIGFSTVTNLGTQVDPGGSTNTKGAYATIGTTVADLAGFMIVVDTQNAIGSSNAIGYTQWLIDIAVGATGSEVVILPNLYQAGYTLTLNYAAIFVPVTMYFPIQIPVGSRIAARAQSTTAYTPDRLIGIAAYGVRV